jgi:DNA-directed RNA polymerase subunit RPC12/RpoP
MSTLSTKLQITVARDGAVTRVTVAGVVDEDADLTPFESLSGTVEINLKGVRRFNSVGTRDWVGAMRRLGKSARVILVECSPAVIGQLNMITGFLAHGAVRSFYAPMSCLRCSREVSHLFTTRECRDHDGLPPVDCPGCSSKMELDELEDSYLLFLREPTIVAPDVP